jgi:hypothetical protein
MNSDGSASCGKLITFFHTVEASAFISIEVVTDRSSSAGPPGAQYAWQPNKEPNRIVFVNIGCKEA